MGYKHYWSRALTLDREAFFNAVQDVHMIIQHAAQLGIQIAGPTGSGKPELTAELIAFNGLALCGHKYRDLGKPFPSAIASGVEEKEPPYDPKAAPWFSGPFLDTRVCGGTCAAEPFVLDRRYLVRDWERPEDNGKYACSCITHFKPYDLVVTAALVRIKERLGSAIVVSSDNPDHGFDDAQRFCRELFGWSPNFDIEKPKTEILI